MLMIDPESLYPFAHEVAELIRDKIHYKSVDTHDKEKGTTLETIPSEDELRDDQIEIHPDTRLRFMNKILMTSSLHVLGTIALSSFFCMIQDSLPNALQLSMWESYTAPNYFLYWSMFIAFWLFMVPPISNVPVLNYTLLGAFSFLTAINMGAKGVTIPLHNLYISPSICMCGAIQTLALALYAKKKKGEVDLCDSLVVSGVCTIVTLCSAMVITGGDNLSRAVAVNVVSLFAQMIFLGMTKLIKSQDKDQLKMGDMVQAMMSYYLSVYGILGFLALFR